MGRKRATQAPSPAASRRKKKDSAADHREPEHDGLFRASVSDVTPLPPRNKAALPSRRPQPRRREPEHGEGLADTLSDHVTFEREPGEALEFARPGLQRQAMRHLRRGGSAIEAELDLHGLTVAQARPLLIAFLEESRRRARRYVRVIHGKGLRSETGEGVLKTMVASWLSQREDVLAFREARAGDGGSGAVNVLLRTLNAE